MDTIGFLKQRMMMTDMVFGQMMNDVSPEVFHWRPQGNANRISALFLHVVTSQDRGYLSTFQGKPTLWESEWHAKLGLPKDAGYDQFNSLDFDLQAALQYGQAVQAATGEYISALQPGELDRLLGFEMMGEQATVGSMLNIMIMHKDAHGGEIACLKGVQGLKGLPF